MELYKIGADRNRAEIIIGPVFGAMVGISLGLRTDATFGLIVGLAVAAIITVLTLIDWGRAHRRRKADGGGDGGGDWPAFDGSSTRHFDANHCDSGSGGGWDGGGDCGGGDGGGGGD